MYRIAIDCDAQQDINRIRRDRHPNISQKLIAFLQEASASDVIQTHLLKHDEVGRYEDGINVQKWLSQHNQGNGLWRVKLHELEDVGIRYRIIYAYVPEYRAIFILGVVKRDDFDYDNDNNAINQRIRNAYQRIRRGLGEV